VSENDREWRQLLLSEIKSLRQEQKDILVALTTVKIKIGLLSSFFGSISGVVTAIIAAIFNKHH
jgi:hypothetical protein